MSVFFRSIPAARERQQPAKGVTSDFRFGKEGGLFLNESTSCLSATLVVIETGSNKGIMWWPRATIVEGCASLLIKLRYSLLLPAILER